MLRYLHQKLIKPIFTINDTPHSIALGTALGVFVSLTPTVGFQMLIAVTIGTLIRANRIIAVILCWITNPITFIPMYYTYYWLGGKILGIELWTFGNFSQRLDNLTAIREEVGYFESLKQLGFETALPIWVGSLIIATLATLPIYPLTLRALYKHRRKKEEKRSPVSEERQASREDSRAPDVEIKSVMIEEKPDLLTSSVSASSVTDCVQQGRGNEPMK